MFCLSKPNRGFVAAFLSAQKNEEFSYPDVGFSRREKSPGYIADHSRIRLGEGAEVFQRAKRAVKQWKMFDMGWIELCWPDAPIEQGSTVAVLVAHLGFWSLNACRIVYVIEESGTIEKYGFAYGTLEDHGEIGEERFTVEINREDKSVWYDLYALSRPRIAARIAYKLSRQLQKRFARDSIAAMQSAVMP
ncbi:MAG: DUF1990 domain-containing protein [Acidobacteriota bacterium]|nr:DUF1990 domain-containing protein [Acidobacteriota bacterium]